MKILNYLNASELTNEIRKNSLSLNIILICTLILPFSFYLGPAIIELLVFLICVSYLYIVIAFIKLYFNLVKIFSIIDKVCHFNFCHYSYFKKNKLFFKIFFYFKFFMYSFAIPKWIITVSFQ